jgi:hypothetical protein
MNVRQAMKSYEKWVASCIPLDRPALSFKHKQMTLGLFPFLRATFYRWAQIWREVAGKAAVAPSRPGLLAHRTGLLAREPR